MNSIRIQSYKETQATPSPLPELKITDPFATMQVSEPVSKRRISSSFSSPRRTRPKMEKSSQQEVITEIVDLDDDDEVEFLVTPISKQGTTEKTAISVEQYSEDRDLNSAIMASLNSSKGTDFIDLSDDYFFLDDDIRLLSFEPVATYFGKQHSKPKFEESVTEIGSSSSTQNDPDVFCEICVETMNKIELFSIKGCAHAYCNDCMVKYVASKLQENVTNVNCPVQGCKGLLEPEHCRSILPQEVFDRWGNALCEALILGSQNFYCPFKDCSAMLIDDGDRNRKGKVVRESECPHCRRLFCAQCKVAWHSGMKCAQFQKLHKDEREKEDIMLKKLAKDKKWNRFRKCGFFIERISGCNHMLVKNQHQENSSKRESGVHQKNLEKKPILEKSR